VAGHDLSEEILEAMWVRDKERTRQLEILTTGDGPEIEAAYQRLLANGMIRHLSDGYALTGDGEAAAAELVRRHRLAERLFHDVLGFSDVDSHRMGCSLEHFLEEDTTDAVCSFLGHPPVCPHNKPIPQGKCCRERKVQFAPVIVRLYDLAAGRKARVMFVRAEDHIVSDRLSSLGIYPGQIIRLHQKLPSFLVQIDQAEIGLEAAVAQGIFVRPVT